MSVDSIGMKTPSQVSQKNLGIRNIVLGIVGTGVSAGGGALLGNAIADSYTRQHVENAKILATPEVVEEYLSNLCKKLPRKKKKAMKKNWTSIVDNKLKKMQIKYDTIAKNAKNLKTKWAIIGAAGAAAITLITSNLIQSLTGKKGKVETIKKDSNISQIVTTQSGYKIAVPHLMGSITKIKALNNGKYEVYYKPSVKDAKAQIEKLSEQELLEKYKNWVIQ